MYPKSADLAFVGRLFVRYKMLDLNECCVTIFSVNNIIQYCATKGTGECLLCQYQR